MGKVSSRRIVLRTHIEKLRKRQPSQSLSLAFGKDYVDLGHCKLVVRIEFVADDTNLSAKLREVLIVESLFTCSMTARPAKGAVVAEDYVEIRPDIRRVQAVELLLLLEDGLDLMLSRLLLHIKLNGLFVNITIPLVVAEPL